MAPFFCPNLNSYIVYDIYMKSERKFHRSVMVPFNIFDKSICQELFGNILVLKNFVKFTGKEPVNRSYTLRNAAALYPGT